MEHKQTQENEQQEILGSSNGPSSCLDRAVSSPLIPYGWLRAILGVCGYVLLLVAASLVMTMFMVIGRIWGADSVTESLYEEFKEPLYAAPPLLSRMVEAGLLGRKVGRGFYEYKR